MNCAEFDVVVHELDGPRRVPGLGGSGGEESGRSSAALAHAESCSRCARLLTEVEGLNFALRAIASHDAEIAAPGRVEAALLGQFRARAAAQRRQQARRDWKAVARFKAYAWYAAVASAAAILLFALGLMRARVGKVPHPPAQSASAAIANPSPTIAPRPLQVGHAVVVPKTARGNGPANGADHSQYATAFYPLPYADDAAPLDGGAVIRVDVPRSALAGWGVPVSGISGAGPVAADLVVAADGTPQAIRFLSRAND